MRRELQYGPVHRHVDAVGPDDVLRRRGRGRAEQYEERPSDQNSRVMHASRGRQKRCHVRAADFVGG